MPEWLSQSQSRNSADQFCRFVARQPILDRLRRTFGYELLFRTGWENRFCADGEIASRHMIDNAVAFGMESLVGDAVPFVNCTRDLLLKGLPTLLPTSTVLEVLEDIEVDEPLVDACKRLCALGYRLALDDYDFSGKWDPLLPYTTFIKVDFRASTPKQRVSLLHRLRFHPLQFVAEKVEDEAELRMAMDEGFHLFQGYFFTRPVVLGRPALNTIINRLRFLAELTKPGFNSSRIAGLLKQEPTIAFRLLRLANSAASGIRGVRKVVMHEPLTNLRTALAMIGEEQFRKLALTAMTSELCGAQTKETLRFILQKARFCELMAPDLHMDSTELYLFGMLAVLHSTLHLSDADLGETLNLRPELVAALRNDSEDDSSYGLLLRLFEMHSTGDWPMFADAAGKLGRSEDSVSSRCVEAQRWAADILAVA